MDVARASDQIDALIEKRARQTGEANAEEEAWKTSVRKHIVVEGKDPVPGLPEACPSCGRRTRVHIRVVFEDAEVEEGGGG